MKIIQIILMLVVIASGCVQQQETIKIGADYATSGNLARYGDWATKGIGLAVEEVNSEGGINGKRIEIVFEDSKGVPSEAVIAYNKLKNVDNTKYVITYQSSIALAVAPLANKDKIIQMDVSATTPLYSTPNDYTFRTGITANQLAEESTDVLFNLLNTKEIGVIYINNDFGKGVINVFKNSYQGKITSEETFEQDASDFKTQLLKLKNTNVSVIFLVSHVKEGGILVKQAKELGFNFSFFTDVYSVEAPDFINTAREAAEGIIYVAPKFDSNATAALLFTSNYKEKYNEEPTYFAAQAYDGLVALAKAIRNCTDSKDTDCVRNELMKLDFEGVSGRIKFDINGDVQKPVELKTIINGTFVRYGD